MLPTILPKKVNLIEDLELVKVDDLLPTKHTSSNSLGTELIY